MELAETIDTINNQLRSIYSIDIASGKPIFRIIWSNDELETRVGTWTDFDASNNPIRTVTEGRLVPKYIQDKDRYILERLVAVPDQNLDELGGAKVSYEPLWVFKNVDSGEYLAPRIDICQFIINTVLEAVHRPKGFARYVKEQAQNFGFLGGKNKQERLKDIKENLFGNETPITDALMKHSGVGYTSGIVLTDED